MCFPRCPLASEGESARVSCRIRSSDSDFFAFLQLLLSYLIRENYSALSVETHGTVHSLYLSERRALGSSSGLCSTESLDSLCSVICC